MKTHLKTVLLLGLLLAIVIPVFAGNYEESLITGNGKKLGKIIIRKHFSFFGNPYSYWYKDYQIKDLNTLEYLMRKAGDYRALDMLNRSKIFRVGGELINIIGYGYDLAAASFFLVSFKYYNEGDEYNGDTCHRYGVNYLLTGSLIGICGGLFKWYGQNVRNSSVEHYNGTIEGLYHPEIGFNVFSNSMSSIGIGVKLVF